MKRSTVQPGVDRRIFRSAAVVALFLALAKAIGMAKEFVIAGVFGRSDELEAFLIAALVPALLTNIVSESMTQSLVPTFVRVRERCGKDRAKELFSWAMLWNATLLVAVSVVMATCARTFFPLLGSHFTEEKLSLAINMFYRMQPVVVLTGISSLCAGVLNAEREFATPAIAPAVTSLSLIILVPLLAGEMGAWSMVWAMMLGSLIHTGWMLWITSRLGYLGRAQPRDIT